MTRRRGIGGALAVLVIVPVLALVIPFPPLEAALTNLVTGKIEEKLRCSGSPAPAPTVSLGGKRIVRQLLGNRLDEIRLSAPDTAMGGAQHAAFAATIRGVQGLNNPTPVADSLEATVTIGFADLPSGQTSNAPTYSVAEDGVLLVHITPTREQAKDAVSVLYMNLELHGESAWAVPQRMRIFGKIVPATQVADQAGDIRKRPLKHLPTGLSYRWIRAESDGIHVALDGTVVTPLSALPSKVGTRTVSYRSRNGLLGISTTQNVLSLVDIPLTIWTKPRLASGKLVLEPVSVEVLGANRPPSDLLAKEVLSQVDRDDLAQTLPALPKGVRYRSVSVDSKGVKVAVGGVTVQPFSELSSGDDGGPPSTFSAEDGQLVATTVGPKGKPASLTLRARPVIRGTTLDLAPTEAELFGGVRFDPVAVLGKNIASTRVQLQPLGKGLEYTGVEVLSEGLRLHLGGKDVPLGSDLAGGSGCPSR